MIKNIFETKIYEVVMPNFDNIKHQLLDTLIPMFHENSNHRNSEGTGKSLYWQVDGQLHNHIEMKSILEFVTDHAKIYWKELGYRNVDKLKITHSWANSTPKGGWIRQHNHLPCPVVGSFYIDATPEMSNIFFEHPLNSLLAHQPYNHEGKESFMNCIEVPVEPGKLVLFPGYLNHWTNKNITNKLRVGLSFNFMNY